MSSPPPFQLFTSLRYDPLLLSSSENSRPDLNFITPSPFYMLAYHRDRMVEAAQHFDFDLVTQRLSDGKALHSELLARVRKWQGENRAEDGPLKLRILFDKTANMTVDFLPIPAVPLETLYPSSLNPPNPTSSPHPAKPKEFKPSPLTGGALNLGPTDSLPAGNQDPSSSSAQPPQSNPFQPSINSPPEWTLRLDTTPTPSSAFTLLKTTEREMYDASRSRALPANAASPAHREVILYNEVKEVTEGTLTSLYFWRAGKWITPPVGVPSAVTTPSTSPESQGNEDEGELRRPFPGRWGHSVRSAKVGAGGQRGTSRRWALGKGFCMEETVDVATVVVGEGVWVSNGVRGFGYGRVVE